MIAALPFVLLAAIYIAATIDIRQHDGRVQRGVRLGQTAVGGMTVEELDAHIDGLAASVEAAPVYIETPDAAYQIEAERLGLTLDRSATRAAALGAGRGGATLTRPFRWVKTFFAPERVDAELRLDSTEAAAGLAAVSRTISVQPGPPTMELNNGRLELVPGEPGNILDVTRLLRDLSSSLPSEPGDAISVEAWTTSDSMIDVDIQATVDRLNGATTEPILIQAGSELVTVPGAEFRSWIRLDTTDPGADPTLDSTRLFAAVNAQLQIAEGPIDTTTLIVDGAELRLPDQNSTVCCDPESVEAVLTQVLAGTSPVQVELIADATSPLVEIGLRQLIGEFTTEHPVGQDRVINIQRMADLVRGAVIQPGDQFSLNAFVGERTVERGFVPAGVIYNGVFAEDVGGGVSQFATTLFNAAFFGGLDLVDYQAHSIYIDRYPYGREATVNWPTVDLVIGNPTPWPVLIWTEHTPSSITVKLFGTAWVTAEQTYQEEIPLESCTRVRTERTRTWLDDRVETDVIWATYQPDEGVGCDGRPTLPPPDCADDEVLVDADDDGYGDACAPVDLFCGPEAVPTDIDGDGDIDYCDLETGVCQPDEIATDTDGNGQIDLCVPTVPDASSTATDPTSDDAATPDAGAAPLETDEDTG